MDALAVMRSGSWHGYSRDWTWVPSRGRDLHFTQVLVMATSLWRPLLDCPKPAAPPQVDGTLHVLGSARRSIQRHEPGAGIRNTGETCGLEISVCNLTAKSTMPYWRLSAFYLFYFASLGALIPYWSLYLQSLGFGAAEIGELVAILMGTKLVAPNVWGWLADRFGRRMAIIRLASLLSALTFVGVFLGDGFWWLALVMTVFSFFWNASLPQFEATTLTHLGDSTHRYSTIRLWGSIGFILTVAGMGWLLGAYGTGVLPKVLVLLFLGIWLASLCAPEGEPHEQHVEYESLGSVLARGNVVALLLVCFLMQASHGPYYTFFSIYLEQYGYSRSAIGQLWALGVIAEIGVFLVMHRWLPRFGPRHLLLVSLFLTTIRWLLLARYPEQLGVMLLAQTLHAASFGVYHAVAIHLIHVFFTGRHQGRGQALYSSLSFGAGGAVGSLASGYLWSSTGPQSTYLWAAVTSGAALGVTWRYVRPA